VSKALADAETQNGLFSHAFAVLGRILIHRAAADRMDRAKEACQEACTRALQRVDQYDSARPVRPWLHGILNNKQAKEWHDDCRGNEQATKASLIAPLFIVLGYDMTDPRECKPEYRMDFGKGERAATPVDWAFLINGALAFFVEAKEAGAKISKYPEQLGMYFG
jgi:hypothetical protein